MTPADPAPSRPARFGLAAKLFAILLLLGAVAVLITGGLGYLQARDSLEQSIFNHLTAARESKAHQVETYFRSVRRDVRLLAGSKMVIESMQGLTGAIDELDRMTVPDDVRGNVDTWYDNKFMPMARRLLGDQTSVKEFLP